MGEAAAEKGEANDTHTQATHTTPHKHTKEAQGREQSGDAANKAKHVGGGAGGGARAARERTDLRLVEGNGLDEALLVLQRTVSRQQREGHRLGGGCKARRESKRWGRGRTSSAMARRATDMLTGHVDFKAIADNRCGNHLQTGAGEEALSRGAGAAAEGTPWSWGFPSPSSCSLQPRRKQRCSAAP